MPPLGSGNPTHTDHLGAAVHADDGTQRPDPNGLSRKAWSNEVEELVDVRCTTVHHCNVFNRPCVVHTFIKHLQCPLASSGLTGFANDATGEVDHRLDRQQ